MQIDAGAARYTGGRSGLDPAVHLLDAEPEAIARYVFIMDATNFGSGWFHELDIPGGESATTVLAWRLTAHAHDRASGEPWTAAELRALDARGVAGVLGQDPAHELLVLYAGALRELGTWLGERTAMEAIAAGGGSAARLVGQLVGGMPAYADPRLLKRAQITVNDLVLAGVATFADVDRLTIFADDLVPHILRCDGVLRYASALAARIDGGERLRHGEPMEVELRARAVEACERLAMRAGVAPRQLDNWLWNRGTELLAVPGAMRPHRTRTTAYGPNRSERAVLLQPVDAVLCQRPVAVVELRRAAVLAQRAQVQPRAHVAMAAADRIVDVGDRDADVSLPARQVPEGVHEMGDVAAAHPTIVADDPTRPRRDRSCGRDDDAPSLDSAPGASTGGFPSIATARRRRARQRRSSPTSARGRPRRAR